MKEPINNSYYRSEAASFYHWKLRSKELNLKDVPEWLLEERFQGPRLFKCALDPTKGVSGDQYEENIAILEREIEKAKKGANTELLRELQEIYEAHAYWQALQQQASDTTPENQEQTSAPAPIVEQQEPEPTPPQEPQPLKKKKWGALEWVFAANIIALCASLFYLFFSLVLAP